MSEARMVAGLKILVDEAHAVAVAAGWHDDNDLVRDADGQINVDRVLAWLALIGSEVSEAVEAVRVGHRALTMRSDGKPEGLPSELADIVIRVADVSGALGIDLADAVAEKMAFNRTRPYRHGGKLA